MNNNQGRFDKNNNSKSVSIKELIYKTVVEKNIKWHVATHMKFPKHTTKLKDLPISKRLILLQYIFINILHIF